MRSIASRYPFQSIRKSVANGSTVATIASQIQTVFVSTCTFEGMPVAAYAAGGAAAYGCAA